MLILSDSGCNRGERWVEKLSWSSRRWKSWKATVEMSTYSLRYSSTHDCNPVGGAGVH